MDATKFDEQSLRYSFCFPPSQGKTKKRQLCVLCASAVNNDQWAVRSKQGAVNNRMTMNDGVAQ